MGDDRDHLSLGVRLLDHLTVKDDLAAGVCERVQNGPGRDMYLDRIRGLDILRREQSAHDILDVSGKLFIVIERRLSLLKPRKLLLACGDLLVDGGIRGQINIRIGHERSTEETSLRSCARPEWPNEA